MKKTLSEILYSAIDATSDEINSIKDSFQEKFNVLNNDITTFTTNIKNNYCSKNKVNKTLSDNFYSANEQNNSIIETSNNSNDVINKTFNEVSNNITNNYSTKTDVNNFQNSVNQDIVKQFSTISSDTTQTINAQYGTKQTFNDTVTTLSTNTLQSTVNNVLNTDVTYNNSTTNNTDSKISFKKYIDDSIFTNRSAKLGYLDNDISANISASYNMNAEFITKPMVISDIEGREWAYVVASNTFTSAGKIYRGYRMNTSSNFSFSNEPVIPPCIKSGYYLNCIYNFSSTYMICNLTNGSDNEKAIISTKYTGNINSWDYYLNITSLNFNGMNSIYYDSVSNRIGIFYQSGQTMRLRLYDESLTLISDFLLLDLAKSFFNKQTVYDLSNWGGNCSCCYIPKINKILIVISWYMQINNKSDGAYVDTDYYAFPFLLEAPESVMKNGTTDTNGLSVLTSDDIYNVGAPNYIRNCINGASYVFAIDELKNELILNANWQDSIVAGYVSFNLDKVADIILKNKKENSWHGPFWVSDSYNWTSFSTDDTCPWAKYISCPVVMGENFYFGAYSKKYGYSRITANIKVLDENSYSLGIKAGEYIMGMGNEFDIASLYQYSCNCRSLSYDSSNKTIVDYNWSRYNSNDGYDYIVDYDNFNAKDGLGQYHKSKPILIKNGSISYKFPDEKFPNQRKLWTYYDEINKKYVTLLQNMSHDLPKYDKEGMGYFVITDETNTTIDTIYMTDETYKNQSVACYDTRKFHGDISIESNMFCVNGYFYIIIGIGTIDGRYFSLYRYNYADKSCVYISGTGYCYYPGSCLHTIGCNETFGFYFTEESYHNHGIMHTSKDIIKNKVNDLQISNSIDNAKNIDAFLKRQIAVTDYRFDVQGSSGLIAFIQSFPIYLGGYYSVVNSKEIYLKPNADNYIYAERDSNDESKVNVTVELTKLSNINPFNKVLLSKITTNGETSIAQETYDINEIISLDKRIAIMESICKRNNIK